MEDYILSHTGEEIDAAVGAVWGKCKKPLAFFDTAVLVSSFVSDLTLFGYEFRVFVPLEGVSDGMIPEVIFSSDVASSGNFSPSCECVFGGINLYAKKIPATDVVISTILCWVVS